MKKFETEIHGIVETVFDTEGPVRVTFWSKDPDIFQVTVVFATKEKYKTWRKELDKSIPETDTSILMDRPETTN